MDAFDRSFSARTDGGRRGEAGNESSITLYGPDLRRKSRSDGLREAGPKAILIIRRLGAGRETNLRVHSAGHRDEYIDKARPTKMETRLTYLPVHCYLEPEVLDYWQDPEVADCFLSRLAQALVKKLGSAYSDLTRVHKLIVPPYLSLISVGDAANSRGVPTAVDANAQVANLPWVSAPSVQLKVGVHSANTLDFLPSEHLISLRKQANNVPSGMSQIVLELIPDHPALGEKTTDSKLACGAIDIPLFASNNPLFELVQKRWVQFTLPAHFGRPDIDEIQLKLVLQLRKSLLFLAERVFTHVALVTADREVSEKLDGLKGNIAGTLQLVPALVQPPPLPELPQISPRLQAYRDSLSHSNHVAESAHQALVFQLDP